MISSSASLDLKYALSPSCVAPLNEFFMHEGEQVSFGGKIYAVGSICLETSAKLNWNRPINAFPSSEEWKALFYHGVSLHKATEMTVVTGLPHTLRKNIEGTYPIPLGEIELVVAKDGRPIARRKTIKDVIFHSECEAHAIAFQETYGEPSLVISIGFGTIELGACDRSGKVKKESLDSRTYGLHNCATDLQRILANLGYERPHIKKEQYGFYDSILKQIYGDDQRFCLRGNTEKPLTREDLKPYADKLIDDYAERLIDQLKGYFREFDNDMPVILTGGGTLYDRLVNKIKRYLNSQRFHVSIADKEMSILSAAIGYSILSKAYDEEAGVGIDIGNSSVVTILGEGAFN